MAIEIGNNWALMPITHPKQNTLQEKLAAGPPSQDSQETSHHFVLDQGLVLIGAYTQELLQHPLGVAA